MERSDIERIRAILRRWGDCDAQIRYQCQRMSEARASIEAMYLIYKSPELDGMPRSTVPGNPTEAAALRIETCIHVFEQTVENCTASIKELNEFKAIVSALVAALPRQERDVIVHVYLDHMDMIAAATLTGVSERTGYNREMSALERINALEQSALERIGKNLRVEKS